LSVVQAWIALSDEPEGGAAQLLSAAGVVVPVGVLVVAAPLPAAPPTGGLVGGAEPAAPIPAVSAALAPLVPAADGGGRIGLVLTGTVICAGVTVVPATPAATCGNFPADPPGPVTFAPRVVLEVASGAHAIMQLHASPTHDLNGRRRVMLCAP
jgi:hypothetical protein